MDSVFEKTLLFDFYGDLLTSKQQEVYRLYQLEDLSLSEVGERFSISRQGIYDTIRRSELQMAHFEKTLGLVDKFIKNKKQIDVLNELLIDIKKQCRTETINQIELAIKCIEDNL